MGGSKTRPYDRLLGGADSHTAGWSGQDPAHMEDDSLRLDPAQVRDNISGGANSPYNIRNRMAYWIVVTNGCGVDAPVGLAYPLRTMLAIIKTGGKQYIVREGETLSIEKLPGAKGDKVEFEVLLRAEEDGSKVDVGAPRVTGAKVHGEIAEQGRAKKIEVVHYKPKVRYKKRVGHRQPFTKVKITKVS